MRTGMQDSGPDPAADPLYGCADRTNGGVDLGVGKRPIVGLEDEAPRETLVGRGQWSAPVDVEQADGRERRARRRSGGMEERLAAQLGVRRLVEAEAMTDELDDAFRIVEVGEPARPVPGRFLEGARDREPEPPPLSGRVGIPAVALADLEDRDVG